MKHKKNLQFSLQVERVRCKMDVNFYFMDSLNGIYVPLMVKNKFEAAKFIIEQLQFSKKLKLILEE